MNKFSIVNDVARTNKCINWCKSNLNNNEWDLQLLSLRPLHYTFKFKDPQIQLIAVLANQGVYI